MNLSSNPLFSVIIPNYNNAKYLSKAIDSVIHQTYRNWEIIIIDNHSIDGSDEIIQTYLSNNIRVYKIKNYGIIAASRNLGIGHSNGQWIAFLDADDWWMKDKLLSCVKILEKNQHDILYHDVWLINNTNKIRYWKRSWSQNLRNNSRSHLIRYGNTIVNSSVVVRKSAINLIGGISEERGCIGWEDYDTWLRLAENQKSFCKVDGILGYYWYGGENVSTPNKIIQNIDEFILKYITIINGESIPWWCVIQG